MTTTLAKMARAAAKRWHERNGFDFVWEDCKQDDWIEIQRAAIQALMGPNHNITLAMDKAATVGDLHSCCSRIFDAALQAILDEEKETA